MAHGIPARLSASEGRRFGLTVGAAFAALAGLAIWRGHSTPAIIFGSLAAFLILGGALVPARLGPIYRGWMAFALAISKVTTPIFMGLIYFLVVTPIALLIRALGRNPLIHGKNDTSFWKPRGGTGIGARSDLQRQF